MFISTKSMGLFKLWDGGMSSNTQGFTSYWRNTLADAESGKGVFERKDDVSFT